jgi:DNA-directed RNA polymerase specialized sigma24 family protein
MEHSVLEEVIADAIHLKGDAKHLIFFIKRALRQFNLESHYQEMDILSEAYIRTQKRIEAGETITNFPAWLKVVSINIIREKSKKRLRDQSLQQNLIRRGHGSQEMMTEQDDADLEAIATLLESLKSLSSEDVEILKLRIVKGLSWDDVAESLEGIGKNAGNVTALRKRGERALSRLRKNFFSVNQNQP